MAGSARAAADRALPVRVVRTYIDAELCGCTDDVDRDSCCSSVGPSSALPARAVESLGYVGRRRRGSTPAARRVRRSGIRHRSDMRQSCVGRAVALQAVPLIELRPTS